MPAVIDARLVMLLVYKGTQPRGTPAFSAKANGQIKGVMLRCLVIQVRSVSILLTLQYEFFS